MTRALGVFCIVALTGCFSPVGDFDGGSGGGVGCGFAPGGGLGKCGNSNTLYCRDACPMCDDGAFICTKVGACVFDFDCPAGLTPPACIVPLKPSYKCVSNACEMSCK